MTPTISPPDPWPALRYVEIAPTAEYLHRLVQIGGKYTLDQPFEPNWGNVTLLLTSRGFATRTLWARNIAFQVIYDILDDRVTVAASTGCVSLPLVAGSVADFYAKFVKAVSELGIPAPRNTLEAEIAGSPHFDADTDPRPYDSDAAHRVWAAFASADRALNVYQSSYRGPRTPVGIMWGGFDLYAPRYNGKAVTPPSAAPIFQQNGMMAEVVAVGLSLGDEKSPDAYFFAYISPPPDGLATADFGVTGASFNATAGLITLPWDVVRAASNPHDSVVAFGDGVYGVACKLGGWPRDWVGARHDGWYASTHRV